MKEQFYLKSTEQRKEIVDELLILALGTSSNLPKTHYEPEAGKYTIV